MWQELIEGVRQQEAFLDLFAKGWIDDYVASGGSVQCGRGCSGCCSLAVNVPFVEAVSIAGYLTDEQLSSVRRYVERLRTKMRGISDLHEYLRMHRKKMNGCPLLSGDGSCGIYRLRPLSCRALVSTRESRWCSADFAELSADEKRCFVEGLDRVVVAFPMHYVAVLQESGREMENESSRRMRQKFGFSLYGNLPVLLYLVRDFSLHEACGKGYAAVQTGLESAGLSHPLLVAADQQLDHD